MMQESENVCGAYQLARKRMDDNKCQFNNKGPQTNHMQINQSSLVQCKNRFVTAQVYD